MLGKIISLISVPVVLLNFLGGIVGGVWLAILGKWGLLGLGLLSIFISTQNIALALAPGLLFLAPGALAMGRGKYLIAVPCLVIGNLWTYAVMAAWCIGSFYIVMGYRSGGSIWPYLLMAYSMATGPWTYMASRSAPDDSASATSAFAACIGAICVMGVLLFEDNPHMLDESIAFCIPIAIAFVIQIVFAVMATREGLKQRKEGVTLDAAYIRTNGGG